jgi:UDP-glucose 4-epimerase
MRTVSVAAAVVRAAVAASWHLHLVPADPALLDLVLQQPLMEAARARMELGWHPERSSAAALGEMLVGMVDGAGTATVPLAPHTAAGRLDEIAIGVGARDRQS